MRIRLFLFILFLPAIGSSFLESASGQAAPAIQVPSLPRNCTNGTLYQLNNYKLYFCTNGIPVPLDSGATPIDPLDYGVRADWKEFWSDQARSDPPIVVSTGSMTITCTGCFNSATDVTKEIVGSSDCNGDVACGMAGVLLFPAGTTITGISNANTATVSAAPLASVNTSTSNSAYIAFGTNDDAAWNAVSTAVANLNTCGTVKFPAGMSNFDTVGKFNGAPASCTATAVSGPVQSRTALSFNSAMAYVGYGPATSRIVLTPAFASSMHSPGCTKACIFGPPNTIVENLGFWGGGNSVGCYDASSCTAGAAPCNTGTAGTGTCTILGAMAGSYIHNVSAAAFGGGANATNTMIGLGGALQDGGGVFASYDNVKVDGFGNLGVTGQNSVAINGQWLDNYLGNFVCNGQCYTYSVGYGNGGTNSINPGAALYTCQNTGAFPTEPCYSTNDYQAYWTLGRAYQAFQITAYPQGTLFITGFLNTPYGTAIPAHENGFYCNNVPQCQVHLKNSQLQGGASSSGVFVSFGTNTGDAFYDEGGNIITGPINWQGAIVADGHSVKGRATGTCTSSSTLGMYGTGANATTTTCTSTTIGSGIVVSGGPRTLYVLQAVASTAGVAADAIKVLQNGTVVGSCVIGAGTSCVTALSITLNDGDLVTLEIATGAATTLANVMAVAAWN